MSNIQLESDERIIIESDNACWSSRNYTDLLNIVLTNKNIYCVYKKGNGLFKKATIEQCVLSLSDIKTINGMLMVQQVKYEGSWCLQIQFRQGIEYFEFYDSPKKVIPKWIEAINSIMETGTHVTPPAPKSEKQKSLFSKAFMGVNTERTDALNEVVDHVAESFDLSANNKTGKTNSPTTYSNPENKQVQKQIHYFFCANCGNRLNQGARFCSSCGSKVGVVKDLRPEEQPVSPTRPEIRSNLQPVQRQIEYVGKIFKCPHCGNEVDSSDVVCDVCGFHFTGKRAISSATDFQQQLLRIEMSRQNRKLGFWDQKEPLDATDKQIISFIKSYPIPNTIDDIVEFFYMAIGNINVEKSKKSVFNSEVWDGINREREISNAWVGKLQQIYKKAELYLSEEEEFEHMKETYQKMMSDLKLL